MGGFLLGLLDGGLLRLQRRGLGCLRGLQDQRGRLLRCVEGLDGADRAVDGLQDGGDLAELAPRDRPDDQAAAGPHVAAEAGEGVVDADEVLQGRPGDREDHRGQGLVHGGLGLGDLCRRQSRARQSGGPLRGGQGDGQTRRVGHRHRVVVRVGVAVGLQDVVEVQERVDGQEAADDRVVQAGAQRLVAGGVVTGGAQEPGVGPQVGAGRARPALVAERVLLADPHRHPVAHGDLGIGAALVVAGQGDQGLAARAVRVAHHRAARGRVGALGVDQDAALLDGDLGLAQVQGGLLALDRQQAGAVGAVDVTGVVLRRPHLRGLRAVTGGQHDRGGVRRVGVLHRQAQARGEVGQLTGGVPLQLLVGRAVALLQLHRRPGRVGGRLHAPVAVDVQGAPVAVGLRRPRCGGEAPALRHRGGAGVQLDRLPGHGPARLQVQALVRQAHVRGPAVRALTADPVDLAVVRPGQFLLVTVLEGRDRLGLARQLVQALRLGLDLRSLRGGVGLRHLGQRVRLGAVGLAVGVGGRGVLGGVAGEVLLGQLLAVADQVVLVLLPVAGVVLAGRHVQRAVALPRTAAPGLGVVLGRPGRLQLAQRVVGEALPFRDPVRVLPDRGDVARRVVGVGPPGDEVPADQGLVPGLLAVDGLVLQLTARLVVQVLRPHPVRLRAQGRAQHLAVGGVDRLGAVPVLAGDGEGQAVLVVADDELLGGEPADRRQGGLLQHARVGVGVLVRVGGLQPPRGGQFPRQVQRGGGRLVVLGVAVDLLDVRLAVGVAGGGGGQAPAAGGRVVGELGQQRAVRVLQTLLGRP
ncbi:hypothetical protein STXM2123_4204 [Streptomyces sp. F-3]|nr:hypothetical protein STXM2123_4204 [Streptomyces sp. F-3]